MRINWIQRGMLSFDYKEKRFEIYEKETTEFQDKRSDSTTGLPNYK